MANSDSRLQDTTMHPSVTNLPPNKRYILTHTATGKSTIHSCPPQQYYGHPSVGGAARSCASYPSLHPIPSSHLLTSCPLCPSPPTTLTTTPTDLNAKPNTPHNRRHSLPPRPPRLRPGHNILPLPLRPHKFHRPRHRDPRPPGR